MKRTAVSLILFLVLGCTDNRRTPIAGTARAEADRATSKEATFSFVAPTGFVWHPEHRIFYNKMLRASISLAHAPSPDFTTIVDEFTVEGMKHFNVELLSKELRDIDGRPTLIVKSKRLNAPYPQKTITGVFATRSGCAQITAIYPAAITNEIETKIEEAVATSRYVEPQ